MLHARTDRNVYVSDPCISIDVCVAEGVVGESPLCHHSRSIGADTVSLTKCLLHGSSRIQTVCTVGFVKASALIAVAAAIRDSE